MDFVPDKQPIGKPNRLGYAAIKLVQAFLEDGLSGYTTSRTENALSGDIISLITHAGGERLTLKGGQSPLHKRPAFLLEFVWGGLQVRIIQVALPVRNKTDRNIQQSRKQALYNLHDSVRMELERRHYQPDLVPFAGYVLPPGEAKTLAEVLADNEMPTMIDKPTMPVRGEVIFEGTKS